MPAFRLPKTVSAFAVVALSTGLGIGASYAAPAAPSVAVAAAAALPADVRSASWTDTAGTRSTYHLFTSGVTAGKVAGLVVYLDGDGMYGHDHPTSSWALGGSGGVPAKAAAYGYATLSVRTPDSASNTFWEKGKVNAAYVAALTRKISGDLGTNHVWFVGYSGGSQLITKFLLPAHAGQFTSGGAVITGGGGAPSSASATFDPAMQARFPLLWYTGSADNGGDYDALSDAKRGVAWYAARGFKTSRVEPAGVTHEALGTRFGGILAGELAKYPAPTTSTQTTPTPTPTTPTPTTPAPTPTTPAPTPTTPTPTPSTPNTPSAGWSATVTPSRYGVRLSVEAPATIRGRVTLTVKAASGRTRTDTEYASGSRVRLGVDDLRSRTSYTYTVTFDGTTRASGGFSTTR